MGAWEGRSEGGGLGRWELGRMRVKEGGWDGERELGRVGAREGAWEGGSLGG